MAATVTPLHPTHRQRSSTSSSSHLQLVQSDSTSRRRSAQVYRRRRVMVLVVVLLAAVAGRGVVSAMWSAVAVPEDVVMASTNLIGDTTYVVQPGDSLTSIAERIPADVPVADMAAALSELNQIDHVTPGQLLVIPQVGATAPR